VASFAILHQSSATLRNSVAMISMEVRQFRNSTSSLMAVYATSDIVNKIVSGNISYPRLDDSSYSNAKAGMAFELR